MSRSPVCDVGALSPSRKDEMFSLMGRFFCGLGRDTFESDLVQKEWVLLLEDPNGALQGFSTLTRWTEEWEGRSLDIVFSGDTVVADPARCRWDLSRAWANHVFALAARSPRPTYWFLICSGFRTYRFLPLFFRDYVPRPTTSDERLKGLLERVAWRRFGPAYREGVVRLANPSPLRSDPIASGRKSDPDVAFFLERNPGYSQGDELACLTCIHPSNLTPAGQRMLRP